MKKLMLKDMELTEESWGYFRPGYYPLKTNTVIPAMVCLSHSKSKDEPDIQFVLVKPACHLKAWEDALTVSEQDFNQVQTEQSDSNDEIDVSIKIENFIKAFTDKGYLPLNKVNSEFKHKTVH